MFILIYSKSKDSNIPYIDNEIYKFHKLSSAIEFRKRLCKSLTISTIPEYHWKNILDNPETFSVYNHLLSYPFYKITSNLLMSSIISKDTDIHHMISIKNLDEVNYEDEQ